MPRLLRLLPPSVRYMVYYYQFVLNLMCLLRIDEATKEKVVINKIEDPEDEGNKEEEGDKEE